MGIISTRTTGLVHTKSGSFHVTIPNSISNGDGFYVSYNNYDVDIYGCDTTALVFGQMQKFYILKGDHRAQYAPLISQGFDACLSYFQANLAAAHKYSDKFDV